MVINIPHGDDGSAGRTGGCGDGGTCSTGSCGAGLEKVYPTAAVRFGYMKSVGEFRYPKEGMLFGCGADVIIQTNRGIELGEMVSLTCDGCDKCVSRDQIKAYVQASGPEYYNFGAGRILRLATDEDQADWAHIRAETLRKKAFCQQRAEALKLPMKVIECEHLFGGERIIFFFMAEGRVDFRTLVREIATEYQTRIEMRQVGARDEARLLADYETCGRECCCKNFLKTLRPISMKMAKMQKATLDPAKVSGRCGRLKCCLRYEHTTYEELNRRLPSMGAMVFTAQDSGRVVGRQIITQLVQIETQGGGQITAAVEDLISSEEATRLKAEQAAAAAALAAERAEKTAAGSGARGESGRGARRRGGRGERKRRTETRGADQSAQSAGAPTATPGPAGSTPPQQPDGKPADNAGDESSTSQGARRRRGGRRRGRRGPKPDAGGADKAPGA